MSKQVKRIKRGLEAQVSGRTPDHIQRRVRVTERWRESRERKCSLKDTLCF